MSRSSKKSLEEQAIDFATLQSAMDQRRQRFLFNVPQPRLTPASPYSAVSQAQINMRRKVEILTYRSSSGSASGGTGTGVTKRAAWAALARSGRAGALSRTAIDDYIGGNLSCVANKLLPTPSTSCGVPGPAVSLQLDPAVPLYGYADGAARTFATQIIVDTAAFRLNTKNELDFLAENIGYMVEDATGGSLSVVESVGAILINPRASPVGSVFGLSFPLALWLTGVQYNASQDVSDYKGAYSSDFSTSSLSLTIQITSITVAVYYNSSQIASVDVLSSAVAALSKLTVAVRSIERAFYGIQYVGMVSVPALSISTQPGDVFSVRATVGYAYNTDAAAQIRILQTGVFSNVSPENVSHTTNCALSTTPPDTYAAGSFTFYPDVYTHTRAPI